MIAKRLGRWSAAVWFANEVDEPLLDDILRPIRRAPHDVSNGDNAFSASGFGSDDHRHGLLDPISY
jgi:hypothetical protein